MTRVPSSARALAVCLVVAACAAPPAPVPERHRLRVLSANVGNLDGVNHGPCPDQPYEGALCSLTQERSIRARIDALAPDVAVLVEVFDARRCEGAHHDCLAVRSSRVAVRECPPGGTCVPGLDTPAQPAECEGVGTISSVSRAHATIDGRAVTLVVMHPLNASSAQTDRCRAAQDRQGFEVLADGPTLLAGDFNFDPYRLADLWLTGPYWQTQVGEGRRFRAHSLGEEQLPTQTWLDLATLDYVLTDFAHGSCEVLGVTAGTRRLDEPERTMDHRALSCALEW